MSSVTAPAEPYSDTLLKQTPLEAASWIWAQGELRGDHYVCFRRRFEATRETQSSYLDISADTDYVATLNGVEIGRGQFGDFPKRKTWTRFPIPAHLIDSENILAILVHHRGADSFDHQKGFPGLIAALQVGFRSIHSDAQWRAHTHPAFRSHHQEPTTPQTGLTFHYDARLEDRGWQTHAYNDSHWAPAQIVQATACGNQWLQLSQRPLPSLLLGDLRAVRIVMQGSWLHTGESPIVAQSMAMRALRAELPWFVYANHRLAPSFPGSQVEAEDKEPIALNAYTGAPLNPGEFLTPDAIEPLIVRPSPHKMDGRYLVIDLGAETVGLLEFEIEAAAGTILDIAHGEHLDDGRVRAKIGARNFADRYICSEGRQCFQMPFRRLGARYLEVHIGSTSEVRLYRFGLRPVEYPVERRSSFTVEDPLATRVHQVAVRTLELCRHEHYEDCPWREQALYGYDSRLQALYGYHAFGDYLFPQVSLSLLHETCSPKGFLELIAPGRCDITIPVFSFAWVAAVAENWLYSGSPILFHKVRTSIEKIIDGALTRLDPHLGLYHLPSGPEFWHFYEWTPGVAGEITIEEKDRLTIHHAAYNLHLHEALRHYVWMLDQNGETQQASHFASLLAPLGLAIHQHFWDSTAKCYRTWWQSGQGLQGKHELVQALALNEAIVPHALRETLVETLLGNTLPQCTLSASYYLVPALLSHSPETRQWITKRLTYTFEQIILSGATSLWETAAGGRDFDFAGSLCHGWGAIPIYLHQASALGVLPLEQGYRRFSVRIYPSRFAQASGSILTPFGEISMAWQWQRDGLDIQITAPEECIASFLPYPEAPYKCVTLNGRGISLPQGN